MKILQFKISANGKQTYEQTGTRNFGFNDIKKEHRKNPL